MDRRLIIVFFISCLFLSACQKDIDTFIVSGGQPNGPDTTWYHNVNVSSLSVSTLRNNLLLEPYKDIIEINEGDSVILDNGIRCYFPPLCCVNNTGEIVTGKVNVEVLAIKDKGDMIRMNKPTTSFDRLLVNDEQIFVRLKKDGKDLQIAPGKQILIKYPKLYPNPLTEFFVGDENNYPDFNWLTNPDPINNTVSIEPYLYNISTNRLQWLSLSTFYDTVGITRTKVIADLPSNYTNGNTIVFAVFKDLQSVVALKADVTVKQFSSGKLPVDKAITLVAISKQGVDYYMGYEKIVTMPSGSEIQKIPLKPIKKSFSDILSFLGTL